MGCDVEGSRINHVLGVALSLGSPNRRPGALVVRIGQWPTSSGGVDLVGLPPFSCSGSFLPNFLWFFELFLRHRHRIDAIIMPLRSSFRYGRSGLCFIEFEGRLTL